LTGIDGGSGSESAESLTTTAGLGIGALIKKYRRSGVWVSDRAHNRKGARISFGRLGPHARVYDLSAAEGELHYPGSHRRSARPT